MRQVKNIYSKSIFVFILSSIFIVTSATPSHAGLRTIFKKFIKKTPSPTLPQQQSQSTPQKMSEELLENFGEENSEDSSNNNSDSQAQASTNIEYTQVGAIQMMRPAINNFILRATVPVPNGRYDFSANNEPFGVFIPYLNIVVPASTNNVSYYPNGNPDVVQVLAHIPSLPADGSQVINLELVEFPHVLTSDLLYEHHQSSRRVLSSAIELHPAVTEFFKKRVPVFFQAKAHGYTYEGKLYHSQTEQFEARQFSDHNRVGYSYVNLELKDHTFVPGSSEPNAPHSIALQVYTETLKDMPYMGFTIRILNAHSGMNENTRMDDPLEELAIEELNLFVTYDPADTSDNFMYDQLVHDPQSNLSPVIVNAGNGNLFRKYQLITPLADGKDHFMKWGGALIRFGNLALDGHQAQQQAALKLRDGLAFAVDGFRDDGIQFYSFENEETARYFDLKVPLPDYTNINTKGDIRAHQTGRFNQYLSLMNSGEPLVFLMQNGQQGPYHNYLPPDGGDPGGFHLKSIEMASSRYALSTDSVALRLLELRGITGRHPNWIVNHNGTLWNPVTRKTIAACPAYDGHVPVPAAEVSTHYLKADIRFTDGMPVFNEYQLQDPWGVKTHDYDAFKNAFNPPDYYWSIKNEWRVIDHAHLARFLGKLNGLIYNGNFEYAKDQLGMIANMARGALTEFANKSWHIDYPGGVCQAYQGSVLALLANTPEGYGAYLGRTHAWPLRAISSYYSVADGEWRRLTEPYFKKVVEMSAHVQNDEMGNWEAASGLPSGNPLYAERQDFEHNFYTAAIHSILMNVFAGENPQMENEIDDMLVKSLYHMTALPMWDPVNHQMWGRLGTRPNNGAPFAPDELPADAFIHYSCPKCHFGTYAMIGYAAAMRTGDELLAQTALNRIMEMVGTTDAQQAVNAYENTFRTYQPPQYQDENEEWHNHWALQHLQKMAE